MALVLKITDRCNMRCTYCRNPHAGRTMPWKTVKAAVDYAVSSGESEIGFYGGEPLLEKGLIRKTVNYADEKSNGRMFYTLTTNGTLLDEDTINFAKRKCITLALSHDGVFNGVQRPFLDADKADSAARMILDPFPGTAAMCTVTPESVASLGKSAEYLLSLGFVKMSVSHDFTDNRWKKEDIVEGYSSLADFCSHTQSFKVLQLESRINETLAGKGRTCLLGKENLCVDVDGSFYPCTSFVGDKKFRIGDVFDGISENFYEMSKTNASAPDRCDTCPNSAYCMNVCACCKHSCTSGITDVSDAYCWTQFAITEAAVKIMDARGIRYPEKVKCRGENVLFDLS